MVMVMGKVEKYMKLHRELLGSYDPLHLPVRPSQEALKRMKGGNLNICSVKSIKTISNQQSVKSIEAINNKDKFQERFKNFYKGRISPLLRLFCSSTLISMGLTNMMLLSTNRGQLAMLCALTQPMLL